MGLGCVPRFWTCKSAYWIQTLATILKSVVFLTPIHCQHSHPYLQFVSTNDTFYQPVSATWTPSPMFENRSNSWRVSIAVRISSIFMHPGGLLTRKIFCNTLKEIMLCALYMVWFESNYFTETFNSLYTHCVIQCQSYECWQSVLCCPQCQSMLTYLTCA